MRTKSPRQWPEFRNSTRCADKASREVIHVNCRPATTLGHSRSPQSVAKRSRHMSQRPTFPNPTSMGDSPVNIESIEPRNRSSNFHNCDRRHALSLACNHSLVDRSNQPALNCRYALRLTLPNGQNLPAKLAPGAHPGQHWTRIFRPECNSGLGGGSKPSSLAPMPEASKNEHHQPVFREHLVWSPRNVLPVKAEPQAHPVRGPSPKGSGRF